MPCRRKGARRRKHGKKRKGYWVVICPAHKVYYSKKPKITKKSVIFPRPFIKPKKRR